MNTNGNKIRVLFVDDHPVVLEGLSSGLNQYPHIEIVGTARSVEEGMPLIDRGGFDLLAVDLFLTNGNRDGLDLLRYARGKEAGCRVIVLSFSRLTDDIFAANQAGADAYLVKDSDLDEIAEAIRTVHEGGRPPLSPDLEAALWTRLQKGKPASLPRGLSEREWEVLRLMVAGSTNEEIAERLFISPRVVRRANTSVYDKLGVRNRAEAVAMAMRENWFS